MRVRAAVIEEKAGPFVFRDLELDEPRPNEVLVRICAVGICQTDIHVRNQDYPVPLPVVLGHEGAGIVEKVGAGVKGIEVGDHVVLSYPSCEECRYCRSGHNAYCEHAFEICFGGSRLDGSNALGWPEGEAHEAAMHGHFFGQSSFATHAVVDQSSVVKVPDDLPLELLAPLGCGFQTGAGAILNSLEVRPGSHVAVFGTGAVGLAAIMAAKVAGAASIIAVDINASRLAVARELGATHTINGRDGNTAEQIRGITGIGADYVLEITARPEMLKLAVDVLAPLGTAALIGGAPAGAEAPVDMNVLLNGRMARGIIQGDAVPQVFIPRLIELYRAGQFPIDRLVRFFDFEQINDAVEQARKGDAIKAVLRVAAS